MGINFFEVTGAGMFGADNNTWLVSAPNTPKSAPATVLEGVDSQISVYFSSFFMKERA